MALDDSGVQLTNCSTWTEATSNRTKKQLPPIEVGVGEDGRAMEFAPSPNLQ